MLFESNAIAQYLASLRRDTELLGRSFFETAQVNAWVDFGAHDVELPITIWVYPVLGWSSFNGKMHEQAVQDTNKALAVMERHLLSRTYFVGEAVTLADICLASALFYAFKLVFDESVREAYPSVTRWFYTVVNIPQFAAVLGEVPLCHTALSATGAAKAAKKETAAKKEAAPKKEKEAAPKKEAAAPAPAPEPIPEPVPEKKADPFASLPKTTMVMDEWKRTYSNSRPDYYASMDWFWANLDKSGYSLWICKYKYNEENKRDFMTSNLVGGYIQRTDEIRRHAFGVMYVLNNAAPYEVEGCWLMRGQDIQPMLDCNPDAEYYDWIKLDADNAEHRKLVGDYWCTQTTLNGKEVYDSKCFK
ncbi:elongation factor 1-gamma family protein [archaeon]|nr:MAG: elongation factor 1-gamma family protein [archaeon]